MELNELTQKIDIKWTEIQNLLNDYKAQQKPVLATPTTPGKLSLAERVKREGVRFWQHCDRLQIHGTLAESQVSGDYRLKLENISLEAVQKIRRITDNDYSTTPVDTKKYCNYYRRRTLFVVPHKTAAYPTSGSYYFEMASLKQPKVIGLNNQSMSYEDLSVGDTVVAEISIVRYDVLTSFYDPLHLTKQEYLEATKSLHDLLSLSEIKRPIEYFKEVEKYDPYYRQYYYEKEVAGTLVPIRAAYMHSLKVMQCKKDTDVL